MHLTSSVQLNSNNVNFEVCDYLGFKTGQFKNQVIYTVNQPYYYYTALKAGKPTYPHQLVLINELNASITQYNLELEVKNIKRLAQEEKPLKPLKLIDENNYFVNDKNFLQFYFKDKPAYKALFSQTAQQVINQTLAEFKSFQSLIKKYLKDKKFDLNGFYYFPQRPYYLEKLQDRYVINFSNQQVKVKNKMLVISWQNEELRDLYRLNAKDKALQKENKLNLGNKFNHIEEIELTPKLLDKLTYKKDGQTHLKLKNNKYKKEVIIDREVINSQGQVDYQQILQTTYYKFPNKIRVKLPEHMTVEEIKQIRVIPGSQTNPNSYTLEIVYEKVEFKPQAILEKKKSLAKAFKPKVKKIKVIKKFKQAKKVKIKLIQFHTISLKQQIINKVVDNTQFNLTTKPNALLDSLQQEWMNSGQLDKDYYLNNMYKLKFDALKKIAEYSKHLFKDLRIVSLDPGMIRMLTMTNNFGEQPVIFKDNAMLAFNQWINKMMGSNQSHIKSEYNEDISRKTKKLNQLRNNKLKNWMHLISSSIVSYLVAQHVDLLVIGKNVGQKNKVNMGKKNNQKFVQIPFTQLWDQIAYKAYQQGILVIEQEESYSSQSSFIFNDNLPVYNPARITKKIITKALELTKVEIKALPKNDFQVLFEAKKNEMLEQDKRVFENHQFSGKRQKGLYKEKDGSFIHSDVNGGYNIMRKLLQRLGVDFSFDGLVQKLENKTGENISRKLRHRLFSPVMMDFNNIRLLSSLNALQELEYKPKGLISNKCSKGSLGQAPVN